MIFRKCSFRLWNAPTLATIEAANKPHRFILEKQVHLWIQNSRSLAGPSTYLFDKTSESIWAELKSRKVTRTVPVPALPPGRPLQSYRYPEKQGLTQ